MILENYDKAAYMTAAKLGDMVQVSESTVVRFALELGYEGYPELQRAVQELVRAKLTSNQRIQISDLRYGDGDILDSVLSADIGKIKYTMENIDRTSFHAAVDAMAKAKRIFVFGARSSSSLATFFNFNLRLILNNVIMVQPYSSGEVFEQILDIGEGDVLFAISFPRYSTKIINAVKYAHAQGATVIALTDSNSDVLVLHPGSHVDAGEDAGIAQIIKGLNEVLTPETKVRIALETMAGKGSEIGKSFEQLARIYEGVVCNDKLRVCFDTCHVHDAGYDIVNDFEGVVAQFDKVIHREVVRVEVFPGDRR